MDIGTDLLFKTQTLTRVVNSLQVPEHGFLGWLAQSVIQEEKEEILFDKTRATQDLAPWVLPTVQGKIVQEKAYETDAVRPAYIKMKTACDINRNFRRSAGEQVGGTLTPRARAVMAVNEVVAEHRMMWMNRLEWMVANVLVNGGYAVYGEDYPLKVLDFKPPKANDIKLTGDDAWTNDAANISDQLQDFSALFAKNGGGTVTDIVLGVGAWKAFRNSPSVEKKYDWASNPSNSTSVDTGAVMGRGLKRMGAFDGFTIWVYQDWYQTDGTEYERVRDTSASNHGELVEVTGVNEGDLRPFMPVNGALFVDPAALMCTRAFGAIRDEHYMGGMTAMPLATRSWLEDDPGIRMLLTQSAPLVFPYRPMSRAFWEVY